MSIANIANGESGSSVRSKLNQVIDEVSPIEAAAQGDVFQKGATNNEAISREDFGKQIQLYNKSHFSGILNLKNVISYDSFIRPNGVIGTSDNGEAWSTYSTVGASLLIISNTAQMSSATGVTIGYLSNTATSKKVVLNGKGIGREFGPAFFYDGSNYIRVTFDQQVIKVYKVIAGGAPVEIFTQNVGSSNRYRSDINIEATLFRLPEDSSLVLFFKFPDFNIDGTIDLSSDFAAFPTLAGGFNLEQGFGNSLINSIAIFEL